MTISRSADLDSDRSPTGLPDEDASAGVSADPSPGRRSLAAWCADRRRRTLLAAVAVLAGAILLVGGGFTTTSDADQLVGDSREAARLLAGAEFGGPPTENVVLTRKSGTFDNAEAAELGARLSSTYQGVKGIAQVGEPALSADRRTVMLPVVLAAGGDHQVAAGEGVGPMLAATQELKSALPELLVGQVGPGSIDVQVGERLDDDFRRAELISVPVTLAVLLVAFGAVVAAGVPVLLAVGAVATALGLTALISRELVPVDQNTQSMVLLIGLAVGVDYALFVLRRSREERAAGRSVRDAVIRASATAGRAVLISGITVVVAMSGMLVAGGLFTSLAIGAMLVVAVAVLAAVTLLPALLALLGDRVDRLRIPLLGRIGRPSSSRPAEDGWWGRLAGRVTRRPLLWSAAAASVLIALAVPATGMRTSLAGPEGLPTSMPAVEAYTRLIAAFPQQGSTVDVVVRAAANDQRQVRQALEGAFPTALATGEIVGDRPQVDVSADGRVSVLSLASPREESDPETARAVEAVRAEVVPEVRERLARVDGAQVHVGGAAEATDLTSWLDGRLPWVVGFVLVLTFGVMLVSFGSLWLAAATVGLNLLSVAAAYGVMTAVFQNSWAEGLLGFTSIGSIAAWLPLLMFVILFGLSMDYHVFVVSRVREAWTSGAAPRDAVRLGVARSAGVVTSAAAVMVAVFAIFGTLSTLEMKQLGVGLATAVLLDATLVRGVLLPGVLALLGRRAHTGPRWVPALHG